MPERLYDVARDLLRHAWTTVDVDWMLDEYEATQWLDRAALADLQAAKLRPLVWHCALFVPKLGQAILERLGPAGISRLEGPQRLPIGDQRAAPETAREMKEAPPPDELNARRGAIRERVARWRGPGSPIECAPSGIVFARCAEGGLHAQADHVLVEVVDDGGAAIQRRATGLLLLTDLHAYFAPRMRIPIGRGRELPGPCRCGRGLPIFGDVMLLDGAQGSR